MAARVSLLYEPTREVELQEVSAAEGGGAPV